MKFEISENMFVQIAGLGREGERVGGLRQIRNQLEHFREQKACLNF